MDHETTLMVQKVQSDKPVQEGIPSPWDPGKKVNILIINNI